VKLGLSHKDITEIEVLTDVAMATIWAFYMWGAHWRHPANMTELSVCGGNAV